MGGPHCKKKYASSYYQWIKNLDFALQYNCGEDKADATARRKGAYQSLKQKFSKLEELNQKYIRDANKLGYVETLPDKKINPNKGYPLLCSRGAWGKVKPTL